MVGRRPFGLVYTALFIGVVVAWFSGLIAWWVAFLVWGGAWLAGLLVQRSARGPVPEIELGPVEFSAGVWVRARPAAFNTWGYGFVRLLVGAGTVATRTRFFPRVVGKLFGTDYTLRAADFEVGTAVHVGSSPRTRGLGTWPGHQAIWDGAVVLRGPYGRGTLELEFFCAEKAAREELQRRLIAVGARPARDLVSTEQPS
jgi:hypothetical protein